METKREFEHISYEGGTGQRSKEVETYNFHKAASVLAEYGFDCIRLSNDWGGADFLAHHKGKNRTLRVQLKSALVVDKKYKSDPDLYMCFPLDKEEERWYLVKHSDLLKIVKDHAPKMLEKKSWREKGNAWTWTVKQPVGDELKPYAYQACHGHLGFRECTAEVRARNKSVPNGP